MLKSDLIRNIKAGPAESNAERIYLTFDLDWCSDPVLAYTLDLLERRDVHATFFVTHETPLLERIRENPKFELGVHPNFNFLLDGDFRYGSTSRSVIDHFMSIVPDAVSVRSHSLVQSSGILKSFSEAGLTHDCNLLLPCALRPEAHFHWQCDLVRVPYIFEDDVECLSDWANLATLRECLEDSFLKVMDWHPIHVFLNSDNMNRYEASRASRADVQRLPGFVNEGQFGAREFLREVLTLCV